ncbi:putative LRR receptor-like serine/threonine-protein kinase isoform X1 [Iris pallida]|uniref:non-specific serine/threonine protein kinase n=1 Tax=Iris pallida TaxID=29817 RepID=A0AAX6GQ43_IRIPA|nr:putative LRR receptor-like serine/threonine-protein kinase isoform X1 [Iris pallida]
MWWWSRRPLLFILGLALICFTAASGSAQTLLSENEIKALKKVASSLELDWDFSVDPCSGDRGWVVSMVNPLARNLTCDCNTTSCHVTSIQLKGLNLRGVLPDEFSNLTYLRVLDLTWNYLNGTIPLAWATLPLTNLSILGNSVSGRIPKELGSITTLQALVLEDNRLEGPLPASLGNLINLDRLILSANNFTGEIPEALGNLKNLTDFRIDGNPITGKIPTFIGNWTKIQRLDMQGTSLEGPFPPTSTLETLTELRLTDLIGGDGKFPPLKNMKNLQRLVLRNLSISGKIPDYIGEMDMLMNLDLSFNNLSGEIPSNFEGLKRISYMYLTNNFLSGTIPTWILRSTHNLDMSYNNFSGPSSLTSCQQANVNLVASYSPLYNDSIAPCFKRSLPCTGSAKNYELFINCGGGSITVGTQEFEGDTSLQGPSTYSESGNWAYSSTGDFIGNSNVKYIVTNTSVLNITNPELYMTARLNPLSLKYYGLCLQRGNYTVNLHFAEIMFTDDQKYSSLGKRVFDVSIQGKKVLWDFNIAEEANGTGREIIKTFSTIVDGSTLEISFQWTGKGTNAIPDIGVYGPLISAISVRPNFKPDKGEAKLSVGAIWGIIAGCLVAIGLILICLFIFLRRREPEDNELKSLKLQTGYFSLKQIKAATNYFDPANKIGEGGFGPVYKGVLPDNSAIAVKQLSSKSNQGNREFVNEIGMISALQHPNLVKLFGFCIEENQLLLIYEYMENNSLALALFGPERSRLKLDWETRCKICLGIARGLAYLHEESRLKIVHRDIKATNVLLDKDLNAKISDFGLARLNEEENTHISTRIAGTVGYMAPEYAMRGYLTDKADVYSFGVVTLEIVSGKSNTSFRPREDFVYLLDWAYVLQEQGGLIELVDERLGSDYSEREAMQMLNLALACTNPSPSLRPTMTSVVSILEGRMPMQIPSAKPAQTEGEKLRFKAFENLCHDSSVQSTSTDGPWMDSSASACSGSKSKEIMQLS